MKDSETNKQEKRFPSSRQGCEDQEVHGSSTEEDRWVGYPSES